MSARNLAVTGTAGDGDAGTVDIAAATLNAWAPAHLTLGGARAGSADAALTVTADHVTVRSGVTLSSGDLLIAARDNVAVENGATITTPAAQDAGSFPQDPGTTTELTFDDLEIPAGPAAVRLRVDGIESPWIDRNATPPAILPDAIVNVP